MLNVVTALKTEAEPIIKYFKLKCKDNIWQNDKINLIITGSGKIKSAVNTALLLNKFPYKTINFGIAGSETYEISQGFFIHKITDTDTGFEYYPDFFKENSSELFCVSKPEKYYTLVDMESSGFFEAAYKFLSVEKIILYKIVSDSPKEKINQKIIPSLIEKHISVIEELIENENEKNFEDIENYINEAKIKMHLTQTQLNELKNRLMYLKIKNSNFPKIPELKTKKEVNEFIKSLTS
jgi:hypothetical protein